MNILVVGPGAMGCIFAARLKLAGHSVTLLDNSLKRAKIINDQGIRVEGVLGDYTVQVPVMVGRAESTPDVAMICVKANDTAKAAKDIVPLLGPETRVLTLQNGVGNVEALQQFFGVDHTLGGVTSEGGTLLGDGHVRHAGQGDTHIGSASGVPDEVLNQVVTAFNESGFKASFTDSMESLIWGKLIVNVGINALTAITRLKNGRLPHVAGTSIVMSHAVEEAVKVAHAKGITLPYPEPLKRVQAVCQATAENIASMLQDVLKQSVTEVAFINGAIVREATALGISTPVNHTLTCLVQAMEETYGERV